MASSVTSGLAGVQLYFSRPHTYEVKVIICEPAARSTLQETIETCFRERKPYTHVREDNITTYNLRECTAVLPLEAVEDVGTTKSIMVEFTDRCPPIQIPVRKAEFDFVYNCIFEGIMTRSFVTVNNGSNRAVILNGAKISVISNGKRAD